MGPRHALRQAMVTRAGTTDVLATDTVPGHIMRARLFRDVPDWTTWRDEALVHIDVPVPSSLKRFATTFLCTFTAAMAYLI